MSTRSQIGFYKEGEKDEEKFQSLIYRHYDGYPSGVLDDIIPILKDFNENRGIDDLEYCSAWLVSKLKNDYLNIGISKVFHLDIEYLYKIFSNGLIEVYEINNWNKEMKKKKLYSFNINNKEEIDEVIKKYEEN